MHERNEKLMKELWKDCYVWHIFFCFQRTLPAYECSFQRQRYIINDTAAPTDIRTGIEQRNGGGSANSTKHRVARK